MDGHEGLRLGGLGEGGNGDWVANGRRWVVVGLADGARCGKVAGIDPMSTKRREFPSAGAVVSLKGSAAFWFCEISDGREGL